MPLERDYCICLRRYEYSETSQILTLFGRKVGLFRVIAKGAHRKTKAGASKFDGGIDLLDIGQAVFTHSSEKELGTLCEWMLTDGQRALHKHLRGLYLGQYAAELVTSLLEEHDPHPRLFDRLRNTFAELPGPRTEEVFLWFQLELLREAGYTPRLTSCSNCDAPLTDRAYFSPAEAGALCRSCETVFADRIEVNPRLLRLADGLLKMPEASEPPRRLPQLTRHQTDPLNRLLTGHVERVVSKPMRLRNYILR